MRGVAVCLLAGMGCSLLSAAQEQPPQARVKAFCVDFNWGPEGFAPPGMFAAAKPAEHLAWYKALGVNTIQTFCVSCSGYAWYQSRVAPVQPGMAGDFLSEMVKLGHAEGMKVMGYFCIGANAYWSEKHPEEVHPHPGAINIPFTLDYLDYLEAVITEAVGTTGVDGFMIDWVYNASHFYPNKEYTWLPCEKQMYEELSGQAWPGGRAMTEESIHEFNRRALDRCWNRIRDAARKANPDCVIWLTCFDLQHPQIKDSALLKEVDWLMNEHPEPQRLLEVHGQTGEQCQLIQCVCGWGAQHKPEKIMKDRKYAQWGIYGFAKADPLTTLPPEDEGDNARNIRVIGELFREDPARTTKSAE